MDRQVYEEIIDRLVNDASLGQHISDVDWSNNPKDPSSMAQPKVSLEPDFPEDVSGYHGFAVDVAIEAKVWGYGDMLPDVIDAMERLDHLFLSNFAFSDGSSLRKLRAESGWQDVETPDPDTIHKVATFQGRYFSVPRKQAIGAN